MLDASVIYQDSLNSLKSLNSMKVLPPLGKTPLEAQGSRSEEGSFSTWPLFIGHLTFTAIPTVTRGNKSIHLRPILQDLKVVLIIEHFP